MEQENKDNSMEKKAEDKMDNLQDEVKKQSSILKKLYDLIVTGFKKFKKAWLTVTALGVIIAGVQLWRDIKKPSLSVELQQIIDKNRLDGEYLLPDSMNKYKEVEQLYKVQNKIEKSYAVLQKYPDYLDQITRKDFFRKNEAIDYLKEFLIYSEYKTKVVNETKVDCFTGIKQIHSSMSEDENGVSKYLVDIKMLDDIADKLLEERAMDSIINVYVNDIMSKVSVEDGNIDSREERIIRKNAKKIRRVMSGYKDYAAFYTNVYKEFQIMINARLKEIKTEVDEGTYRE
ncbi:MAG: hypothetical protein MJY66_02600 [Bacteroidaceae bacterium]|nr:hypothetical protein [Bacteroidaceae bacterium]